MNSFFTFILDVQNSFANFFRHHAYPLIPFFQGGAAFDPLSMKVKDKAGIVAVFSNDCDSTVNISRMKLWHLIDPKSDSLQDNLQVKFGIANRKHLNAYLLSGNNVVSQKMIKGKFMEDNCFYPRRHYLLVPILPILWWYHDARFRFYERANYLVVEEAFSEGGAVIIMASGHDATFKWYYSKVSKSN